MARPGAGGAATARSGDLEMAISVTGTVLHVAFANRGPETLAIWFASETPSGRHHDHLAVRLAGAGGERTLRFTGDRDASTTGLASLAPGEELADELDLAAWALAPVNGRAALAAGDHALTADYSAAGGGAWEGSLSAGPVELRVP